MTQKSAATAEILSAMLSHAPAGLAGKRDRAVLTPEFAGAFRRNELAPFDVAGLRDDLEGIQVTVRRSKTDQERKGIDKVIPHGRFIWPMMLVRDGSIRRGPWKDRCFGW